MHPRDILAIFHKVGSDIKLDGAGVTVVNPKNVTPLTIEFAKENKKRILIYLKGDYSDKKHSILSTNDQLIEFFLNREVNNPKSIDSFLRINPDCADMVIKRMQILKDNGWKYSECTANYENEDTDMLAEVLYNRAMNKRTKKGA